MATTGDFTKIRRLLINTDVNESCTRESTDTQWKFYKLTTVLIFAALLEEVPMGCRDTLLQHPLYKNHSVKCITFEKKTQKLYRVNFCLFGVLALCLHGKERLEEETCKLFILFPEQNGGIDPTSFRGVCIEGIAAVEDNFQADILLYDIHISHRTMIGKLARRSVGKH